MGIVLKVDENSLQHEYLNQKNTTSSHMKMFLVNLENGWVSPPSSEVCKHMLAFPPAEDANPVDLINPSTNK